MCTARLRGTIFFGLSPNRLCSGAAAANAYAEQRFSVYRRNRERQRRKKNVDSSHETKSTVFCEREV